MLKTALLDEYYFRALDLKSNVTGTLAVADPITELLRNCSPVSVLRFLSVMLFYHVIVAVETFAMQRLFTAVVWLLLN